MDIARPLRGRALEPGVPARGWFMAGCEGRPHSARRGHGLRIAKATSSVRISVLIRQRRSQWALTPSQRDLPEVRVGAWVLPIPPRVQHVQGERSGYSMVHAATTAVRSAALAISVR